MSTPESAQEFDSAGTYKAAYFRGYGRSLLDAVATFRGVALEDGRLTEKDKEEIKQFVFAVRDIMYRDEGV